MGELGKCLFVVTWLIFAWAFHAQAQVEEDQDACTHTSWWKPDGDELKRILDNHRQWAEEWGRSSYGDAWAERHTYRRAYLCNADLRGAQLNEADLSRAQLNEADLSLAQLKDATLSYTNLTGAIYAPASPLQEANVRYLTFLLDGDEAGRAAVPAIMAALAVEPFLVKFGLLPEGTQPDTVPEAFLRELLRLRS